MNIYGRGPIQLLVVEDNPIDARTTLKALTNLTITYEVAVAHDGDHAIRHLASETETQPDLILLDLNLPGRNGLDVLSYVKQDARLRSIPVVVLTTSSNSADVRGAYDRGANAYINKPINLAGWKDAVDRIEGFWFSLVQLPTT